MEKFQEFLKDLIQRIADKGEVVPQALTFMLDADETDCKLTISTLLDEEYDVVLDYMYSLLPSQGVEIVYGVKVQYPPIFLN